MSLINFFLELVVPLENDCLNNPQIFTWLREYERNGVRPYESITPQQLNEARREYREQLRRDALDIRIAETSVGLNEALVDPDRTEETVVAAYRSVANALEE